LQNIYTYLSIGVPDRDTSLGPPKYSAAQADVAMFALKGCTVAEIADIPSAAQGMVRAQLSQVYAKRGGAASPC